MENKFVLVTEGGYHNADYLWRMGLRPSDILLDVVKFMELAPYLTKDDLVLFIIKGFTDFAPSDLATALYRLEEVKHKVKQVVVISNMPLDGIDIDYYLHTGDIFFGDYFLVTNGLKESVVRVAKKSVKGVEEKPLDVRKKEFMHFLFEPFRLFKMDVVKPRLFSAKSRSSNVSQDSIMLSKIVEVDLFK